MPERRESYKKSDIRMALINALRSREMTRKDIRDFLSEEYKARGKVPAKCPIYDDYKVCKRTVKRAIEYIQKQYGKQLDINKEFGTYKLELYDFPDTVDDTEIQALDVAIQRANNNLHVQKLLKDLKKKITDRLYRKIEHLENRQRAARKINEIDQKINSDYAFVGPHPIIEFDPEIKNRLDAAIYNQHEVKFKYRGKDGKKKDVHMRPLGIMYSPTNVYLIANAFLGANPIHYILSNITDLVETDTSFEPDNNFSIEEYANSMFGTYNDGKVYDIEWLIRDPDAIKAAEKYKFHTTQNFVPHDDGSMSITMRTGGLRAISLYLTQWGGNIIPIKPQELIDEYRALLTRCLDSISTKPEKKKK